MSGYIFGINDAEYHCRNCFNLQVAQIKSVSDKYLKELTKLNRELDDEDLEKITKKDLLNKKLNCLKEIKKAKWPQISTSILFGNFIASIMKQKRENQVKYMILCWDKTPYYHKTAIENYKGDRYNAADRLQEIEEELKDETLTATERDILNLEKYIAQYDQDNFWKYQEVKRSFIEKDDWNNAGFYSIYKRGYEADQLAYMLSSIIAEKYKKDKKTNCVLLSADKDWANFQKPGVVFTSTWSGNLADRHYGNLTEEWDDFHKLYRQFAKKQKLKEDWKDITRYEYGILKELISSSHNNATLYDETDDDFKDVLTEKYIEQLIELGGKNRRVLKPQAKRMAETEMFFRIINKCKNKKFSSYELLKKAFVAMNINLGKTIDNGYCDNIGTSYVDDIKPLCMSALKNCNKYKRGTIINLCEEHEISVNMMNYSTFVKSLKGV